MANDAATAVECLAACTGDPTCIAVDFNPTVDANYTRCFLHDDLNGHKHTGTQSGGFVNYNLERCCIVNRSEVSVDSTRSGSCFRPLNQTIAYGGCGIHRVYWYFEWVVAYGV